jgi:predicted amidohydrolase YtcJ
MRVVFHSPLAQLAERLEMDASSYRADDPWVRWGGVKIFMDGSLGSRSAYMLEPYPDGSRGRLLMSVEEMSGEVLRAACGGIAPTIHAIGDACLRVVLDGLEEARRRVAEEGLLWPQGARIEHAQAVRPEEIPRLAEMGLLCAMQPVQLADDVPLLPRLWPGASRFAYPTRSLLDAGVRIALGSDAPVADPDPRQGIYAALERRAGNRPSGESWLPQEALRAEEALAGYTLWSARAGRWEEELGVIREGALADLVALELPSQGDGNEAWLQAPLRLTLVDGRIVYEDLP